MSGPIQDASGTSDGVSWTSTGMVDPAVPHMSAITPPSYYAGSLPYYGDFQHPHGSSTAACRVVITLDTPIKRVRCTAQFVGASGWSMHAVATPGDMGPGDTFTGVGLVTWDANSSGTRTLTVESGFRVIVLQPSAIDGSLGSPILGVTFRNMFFFEEIVAPEAFAQPAQDVFLPRGVGRVLSFHWPQEAITEGDPPNMGLIIRGQSLGWTAHMSSANVGSPPAQNNVIDYRGRRAMRITSSNAGGRYYGPVVSTNTPYQLYVNEGEAAADLGELDELAVWQLEMNVAFEQPPGAVINDCGFQMGPGDATSVRRSLQQGVQFGLRDIDTLGVTVRKVDGAAATLETTFTADDLSILTGRTFDIEDWHNYKLRLVGARFGVAASVKLLIDDVLALTIPFGTDTVLPTQLKDIYTGYYWTIGNTGQNGANIIRMYLARRGFSLTAGPTEDSLA